mmetsp:Transcript_5153/g.7614  ORF Transcript_5153/g.7614 Transcript_5153/m.7614 type:complete len:304 (-) Transcript_5153:280-1191(-)|eukprot:CAMPEP_0194077758 /NCGR_PEP_ID=MMETSP0149-20130528/4328_1 /TAXON_ID=122233 /ORGANISM="Chaetoceros debilis, Strain MM31A-1" /LENGTH=303 /DNA_ID=CAMNT_0038758873 /DNA_START=132 /DNA_END=1043 /DNA_ORIENTATION=-
MFSKVIAVLVALQITMGQGFAPSTAFSSTSTSTSTATAKYATDDDGDGDGDAESLADLTDVGFVLLAGGTGSRMKANMPKQFMELKGMPVLHHSLDLFLNQLPAAGPNSSPPIVVLVMDPMYQPEYQPIVDKYEGRLAFANPGVERQGSVENGVKKVVELAGEECTFVAIHDSARPLVTMTEISNVVSDAKVCGAAVLGVPCKATIKESEDGKTVLRTIPRARLWEVHTPQVINIELLQRGFEKVEKEGLEVTDDVSIVEAMGEPVTLTLGEYTNLKITTPEDMDVATAILDERKKESVDLLA